MKRILLLAATNFAVLIVLSMVWNLFLQMGGDRWMAQQGLDVNIVYTLFFAAIFGFGGAIISLLMSKWMAKRSTGARVISEPQNAAEMWLVNTVQRQARTAGIGMPEVAIFDAPEPNAFATGASRNNALVAVSTGLLKNMSQDEVEAVLGHEVSHVANGDMVTLTLVQGVTNTFVLFLSRIIGMFIDRAVFRNERGMGPGFYITSMVLQVIFGIFATAIVCWVSRKREFKADEGGAALAGRRKMISALERLQSGQAVSTLPESVEAFGVIGAKKLFMTHPPLEERIAALQAGSGAVSR